ncbi:MAG: hypothetical protein V2A76_02655 [Planctomycetota bacterium]
MKPIWFSPLLVLAAFTLLGPGARGQGFSAEEQKVYDQFIDAGKMGDLREQEQIARKNKPILREIYGKLEGQMTFSDSIDTWDIMKNLARAMDEVEACNVYQLRLKRVMTLDLEQRKQRSDLIAQYSGLYAALKSAVAGRDVAAIQQASDSLIEVADGLGKVKEAEYQAYCLTEVANALKDMDKQLDAVKLYDQIDTILKREGFQNFPFHGQVVATRDSLMKMGFDPNAKPGESTGPAGNSGTSWSKDPAGERYTDPVPLKYVEDAKLPAKFITPAHSSSENTMVWDAFVLQGDGPMEFSSHFMPMGEKLQISRKGVKVFMDVEGQKTREIKVINKPNLVDMEKEYQDMDGKKQKLQYAWLAATGGPSENRFNMSLNAAPSEEQFLIRYQPACYLKGKVLGQDVMVFDDNCSGRFGDSIGLRDNTTTLAPSYNYSDAMIIGKGKVAGPFTEYLEVDGEFYRLKLSPDDYSVRTRKLDVDVGTVTLNYKGKIPPQVVVIEETREFKGAFFAIDKKPVTVPVGWYRVSYGIIRKGKKEAEDYCLILPGKSTAFEVKKDENYDVELGEPFAFDFESEQGAGGAVKVIGKSVVIYGKAGELYTRFYDDPPIPDKVSMRIKGGLPVGKAEEMGRAGFEEYREDGNSVWQPQDLTFPGSPNNSYEIKMELKKHDLLGGPIKSDWK